MLYNSLVLPANQMQPSITHNGGILSAYIADTTIGRFNKSLLEKFCRRQSLAKIH